MSICKKNPINTFCFIFAMQWIAQSLCIPFTFQCMYSCFDRFHRRFSIWAALCGRKHGTELIEKKVFATKCILWSSKQLTLGQQQSEEVKRESAEIKSITTYRFLIMNIVYYWGEEHFTIQYIIFLVYQLLKIMIWRFLSCAD